MTDKEMAERSFFYKELTYKVCREERSYVDGFLDGLKAGKLTKWHRVADGDLPKDNRTVLDEAGDRFYYFRGHFYYEDDSIASQPIVWCEVPTYSEEVQNDLSRIS